VCVHGSRRLRGFTSAAHPARVLRPRTGRRRVRARLGTAREAQSTPFGPRVTYVDAWLRSFLLTLAVEVPLATPLLGGTTSLARRAQIVVVANLATHPTLWFVLPELFGNYLKLAPWPRTLLGELWVCGVETWIYGVSRAVASRQRALAVAFGANVASFVVGMLLWR